MKTETEIITIRMTDKTTRELLIAESSMDRHNSSGDRWDEQWAVDREGAVWTRERTRPDCGHVRDNAGDYEDRWLESHPGDQWGKWRKTGLRQPNYYAGAQFPA